MLWKQRGYLTSFGHPIKHGSQVSDLLEAIQLPKKKKKNWLLLRVLDIPNTTPWSKANNFADAEQKKKKKNRLMLISNETVEMAMFKVKGLKKRFQSGKSKYD